MAKTPTTTELVPIKEIRGTMILLKDGSVRSIIDVSAINFDLRSSDEQLALIQQFQNFLNSVDFRMQIVIQSRKYDINNYITFVQAATDTLENDMLIVQAGEYMRFVRELSDLANIMIKKFYVVIPIEVTQAQKSTNPLEEFKKMFSKKKKGSASKEMGPSEDELSAWQEQLDQRAGLIISGLTGMGLEAKVIEDPVLTELFTNLYNPEVPSEQQ